MSCKHESLYLKKIGKAAAGSYPAPLILPGDLLEDPEGGQTYEEFLEEERNQVSLDRKTIYLVPVPAIDSSIKDVKNWAKPTTFHRQIAEYVKAFFGLPVKIHDGIKLTKGTGIKLDMLFDDQVLDIRTRACPDKTFQRQLNLNYLLDVLINMLPDDAYAMMLLVDQDMYEDEDDDFCCGRAYGLSRVGVVSTARYNPDFDEKIGLDREHAWPASHCLTYMASLGKKGVKRKVKEGAMRGAVSVFSQSNDLDRLWLSRVCKTVCHELGHCFGIDHCEKYACLMQGTCGLLEDARQPPYFCPVDDRKLVQATKISTEAREWAMLKLLKKQDWKDEPMFAAYEKWLSLKE